MKLSDTSRRLFVLHWLAWINALTAVALLLMARGHYTIDVIIAYWVTTRLWYVPIKLKNILLLNESKFCCALGQKQFCFIVLQSFMVNFVECCKYKMSTTAKKLVLCKEAHFTVATNLFLLLIPTLLLCGHCILGKELSIQFLVCLVFCGFSAISIYFY